MLQLWIKAFHIIFVITWFAGLFYLPRLFVYHAVCNDETGHERFLVMERKLFAIMSIGGAASLIFGAWMLHWFAPVLWGPFSWLHLKLCLVFALVLYHLLCYRHMLNFRHRRNVRGHVYFRLFNEVPALLLIALVVLVVVKPF
ncbi:MAG: CopD family protein [Gammaproteobacteria bacterium]|nr:CopD family protein [Gammaproteobacteria bacterium]